MYFIVGTLSYYLEKTYFTSLFCIHSEQSMTYTVKSVLETTCIKRPPTLRNHCSDTAILHKST